jgi:dolichol-phosphate mannosyltransferase
MYIFGSFILRVETTVMKPAITIIIPARNEAGLIKKTLDALKIVQTPHSILVVSDVVDPADRTEDVVKHYMQTHPYVQLLSGKGVAAHGFAAALKRGVEEAKTPYIVFVMADMCDDPKTIDRLYKQVLSGWDVVCACRYMQHGKRIGGPVVQGLCSRVVNWCMRYVTGIRTHDASNSFKLYTTTLIQRLPFDETMGSEVSLSLIVSAHKKGARITDVPSVWHGRTEGEAKFRFMAQMRGYFRVCLHAMI